MQVHGVTLFNHLARPNAPSCTNGSAIRGGTYPAGGAHAGGVNAATADGAVRFVADSIDLDVWRAAGTAAGGEAFRLPD